MILEQEGVYGYCELDALDIDLVTLDTDILSLEMPEFFKSFYLVCIVLSLIHGLAVLLHSQTFFKINRFTSRGSNSAISFTSCQ